MKNILSLSLISAITLVLLTGCNSGSSNPEIPNNALEVNTHSSEEFLRAVKVAGEKSGWKITPFKSNEVVAEKISDGDTVSSSIKFSKGYIEFEDPSVASSLSDAIDEELNKDPSEH